MEKLFFDTIIIINLERRPDKYRRLMQRIDLLGIEDVVNIIRLDAVDGQKITKEEMDKENVDVLPWFFDPNTGRGMTMGEIGCSLSHYYSWKEILENEKIERALIIEDDAVFSDDFVEVCQRIVGDTKDIDWDLFYLGRKRMFGLTDDPVNDYIVKPKFSYWCLAYVVTKEGAKKLVNSNFKERLIPADEFVPIMVDTPNPRMSNIVDVYEKNDKLKPLALVNDVVNPENNAFMDSETEKTKVFYNNEPYKDEFDSFIVVTVATERNEALERFVKSCNYYRIPHKILGLGDDWKSGKAENGVLLEPGGAQKIIYLRDEMRTWDKLEDTIVMFTDSYDVVFNSPPSDILNRFRSFKKGVVFSAEKTCWPDPERAGDYPDAPTDYKFLNSGGIIGYADKVFELINEDIPIEEDDQRFYTNKLFGGDLIIPEKEPYTEIIENTYERHENGNRFGWMSEPYFDPFIVEYLKDKFSQSAKVLDIGGGDGKWARVLGSYFREIDCVEIFEPYIERYNLKELYSNVYLSNFLDFEFDYYDVVVMGDVFEHVTQEQATKWLNKVRDKVGEIIIVVPFEYLQDWDGVYENVYGHHHQPDLTPLNMLERYPMLKLMKWTDQRSQSNEGEGFGWYSWRRPADSINQDIALDYHQRVFQTLNLATEDVRLNQQDGMIYNDVTNTCPTVIHANGSSEVKEFLDKMTHFMFGENNSTYGSLGTLQAVELDVSKTFTINVMLDIDVHDINQVFDQIRYLTYPKDKIKLNVIYNKVEHDYKIDKFVGLFGDEYMSVQKHFVDGTFAEKRDFALEQSIKDGSDYSMIMDANYIFRNRKSLQFLVREDRKIISPMIVEEGTPWVNFWYTVNKDGYIIDKPEQERIKTYELQGCWSVGYTCGIWMFQNEVLDDIKGSFTKNLQRWGDGDYDVCFSYNVRDKGYFLYVTNNNYFGGII